MSDVNKSSYTVRPPILGRIIFTLPYILWVFIVSGMIFLIGLGWFIPENRYSLITFALLVCAIVLYVAWHEIFYKRLVLTPKCLILYNHGVYRIEYDNLVQFSKRTIIRRRTEYGILLKHGVRPSSSIAVPHHKIGFLALDEFTKLPMQRELFRKQINLEEFQQTEFGRRLKFYAPQLFEVVPVPPKGYITREMYYQSQQKRQILDE